MSMSEPDNPGDVMAHAVRDAADASALRMFEAMGDGEEWG